MRNLKKVVLALVLTVAALASTAARGDVFCLHGMTYCECQGFVGCAFDCFAACE
jgi:hypothetical protein